MVPLPNCPLGVYTNVLHQPRPPLCGFKRTGLHTLSAHLCYRSDSQAGEAIIGPAPGPGGRLRIIKSHKSVSPRFVQDALCTGQPVDTPQAPVRWRWPHPEIPAPGIPAFDDSSSPRGVRGLLSPRWPEGDRVCPKGGVGCDYWATYPGAQYGSRDPRGCHDNDEPLCGPVPPNRAFQGLTTELLLSLMHLAPSHRSGALGQARPLHAAAP